MNVKNELAKKAGGKDQIPEDVFLFLLPKKDIIYSMWGLYLKYDILECSTWEQVEMILEYRMLHYHKNYS